MNDPGQTWRRAISAVAAGAALLLSALTPTHPASIERRPDGMLLVPDRLLLLIYADKQTTGRSIHQRTVISAARG